MSWPKLKVSDFAEVITGGTPSTSVSEYWDNGTIPWLNSGDLNKRIITYASNFITEAGLKSSSTRLMPKNSVLIALTGSTTGISAISKIEACANQSVTGILPSDRHHPDYLYYFFRTQREKIFSKAWGGAQPHINQKFIKDYTVPLPPITEQIKISQILIKAEELIKKRKYSIERLEELLKCTFLQFFGTNNENNYEIKSLDELSDKVTDGEHGSVEKVDSGRLYLMARNINKKNELDFQEISYITEAAHQKIFKRCNPEENDLLMVCVGATIGKVALVPKMEDFSIARSVALIKPNRKKIDPRYLLSFFNTDYGIRQIKSSSNEAAQAGLYTGNLKKIKVPLPPLKLQEKFAEISRNIEAQKRRLNNSLFQLEKLYQSISQRVFEEKLDLKNISVSIEEEYFSSANDRTEPEHFPDSIIKLKKETKDLRYGDPFEVVAKKNENTESDLKSLSDLGEKSKIDNSSESSQWRQKQSTKFGIFPTIDFSEIEAMAMLEDVFLKKEDGFTFKEFELFIKEQDVKYNHQQLKDFLLKVLKEEKLITQYFFDDNWQKQGKIGTTSIQDDFSGNGKIYFVPNKSGITKK